MPLFFFSPINLILGGKNFQGLQHSLVSAQKISNASMNFFNELHSHASKVMTLLEESQIERSNQLVNFEKMFKVAKIKFQIEVFHSLQSIYNLLHFVKTGAGRERGETGSSEHCRNYCKFYI